jgi:hypothetical protein
MCNIILEEVIEHNHIPEGVWQLSTENNVFYRDSETHELIQVLDHTITRSAHATTKTVIISIYRGVPEIVSLPDDVQVIIKDYDVDGFDDPEELKQDDAGRYLERIYDQNS